MTDFPLVSIIIPVKNGERTLEKCLNSILALDYPNYEVWVIDDGSTDATPEILRRFQSHLEILRTDGVGPSKARNDALKLARGELVAFTDADCLVDRSWIRELVRGLREFPAAVSCGGRQDIPADASSFEKEVFSFLRLGSIVSDYARGGSSDQCFPVRHNPSCNSLYIKNNIDMIGGFSEDLWPGEDVDLDYRLEKAGGQIIWNPRAVVYHYKPRNFSSLAHMMFRYGEAQGWLVRKWGPFRKIHFLAFLSAFIFPFGIFHIGKLNQRHWAAGVFLVIAGMISFRPMAIFACGAFFWGFGYGKGCLGPGSSACRPTLPNDANRLPNLGKFC